MNPSAIKGVEVVTDGEAGITLRHPTRGEVQLHGVAAAVWRQADGARSVAELAAAVNADESAVWAALDELGDADLLSERVAPPAGIHENVRREVVFAADAVAAADPDAAAKLEAQFDADAAKGEQDLKLPQAEERRKHQQEAAQDAEENAASNEAMAKLDSRPEVAETLAAEASPAELREQAEEEKQKSARLAEEVAEAEAAAPAEPEAHKHEEEKKRQGAS